MGTIGYYLARQMRWQMIPYFRAYRDHVLHDALLGFANLEDRAEAVAEETYDSFMAMPASEEFDPDPSEFAETAREHGQAFYDTMSGLRQATINLLAAGLFHGLEQQLAFLCGDAAFRDLDPVGSSLADVAKWYKRHLDLDLKSLPQWATIDELRLVANAVKHAEGRSAEELRQLRPDLFDDPRLAEFRLSGSRRRERPLRLPLAGDDLFVTEEQFGLYAVTVCEFVEGIAAHFQAVASKVNPGHA